MRTQGSEQRRIDSRRRIAMKVTTMRHPVEVKLFVTVVLATCLFVAAVNAQPRFRGKFTLPYEVHWGDAVLPAGEYFLSMDPFEAAAVVRSASGHAMYIPAAPASDGSEKRGTCLVIMVRGDQHRVLSLNLPELGQSLIYERLTKSEREVHAKTDQIQAVPLLTAGK
jgi:hypothetical protein